MTPATAAVRVPSRHYHGANNSRSSNSTFSTGTDGWSHVWNNYEDLTNAPSIITAAQVPSSWQEEAHWMSFRHAVHQFASLALKEEDSDEDEVPLMKEKPPSPATSDDTASGVSSLTADLAETKMRLALAQAERDELEFALLQQQTEGC